MNFARMYCLPSRRWMAAFTFTLVVFYIFSLSNLHKLHTHFSSALRTSNMNSNILPIRHNVSDELHFIIQHAPAMVGMGCGGCDVLNEMIPSLQQLGYHVSGTRLGQCPDVREIERTVPLNRTLVIVHPEIMAMNCSYLFPNRSTVTVRWILAAPGVNSAPLSELNYHRDDFIFSYGPKMIEPMEHWYSNILMIVRNPYPGDETDISDDLFYNKNRSGILWTMRKGHSFHPNITFIHEHPGIPSTNIERDPTIDVPVLLKYEYFVSYDPLTYLTFLAAMAGTVSVVYPVAGETKEQWSNNSILGPYLRAIGKTEIPGVAYGWSESEISFSRQTMHQLRPFMMDMKTWGRETTVNRFARDCYRYKNGIRTNFEAGLLAKDAYPSFYKQGSKYIRMEYVP